MKSGSGSGTPARRPGSVGKPRCEAHAQHQRVGCGVDHLVEAPGIKAGLQADLAGVGRAGEGVGRIAASPGPFIGRDSLFIADLAALVLAAARDQAGLQGVQAERQVGHRVGLHQQGLRARPGAVDDAAEDLTGDALAARPPGHRQAQPLRTRRRGRGAHRRVAGVVALPGAGQQAVAGRHLGCGHREDPATVGHVVPKQAAGLGRIHRRDQHEGGHIACLAIGLQRQADVLDQRIARQPGVELAKGPARDLLVGKAGCSSAGRGGHRQRLVDDDAGDAGLGGRCQQAGRDGRAGRAGRTGQPSLVLMEGCLHVCLRGHNGVLAICFFRVSRKAAFCTLPAAVNGRLLAKDTLRGHL